MSDRTSAGLFATFYEKLASDPTPQHIKWAHELWVLMGKGDYDFSHYQLGCEKALKVLGLARKRVGKEYPEDGPIWHYGLKGSDDP
jgi:hypothetical protein